MRRGDIRSWLRLALRQIQNNKRFSLFFCFNLALGLSGFIALDAFKTSLQAELHDGSRKILAADIAVRVRNRQFTDSERQSLLQSLPTQSETARSLSMFTMAAAESGQSRLITLRGVTSSYPLYGSIQLRANGTITRQTPKTIVDQPVVWIYPELAVQLSVGIGDRLKIGNQTFTVADVVEQDSTGTASAFNFAPKIFIGNRYIDKLGLMGPGSRFDERFYIRFSPLVSLEQIAGRLKEIFKADKNIRVRTHVKASENLARSLTYLTDYLGLVALVALFLSGLGSAYLFRSFLLSKRREIATLMSIGATPAQAQQVYVLQLLILGALAAGFALILAACSFPMIPVLSKDLLPLALYPQISFRVAILALLMGTGGSVLICLPLLHKINEMRPALLFNEFGLSPGFSIKQALLLLPILIVYWLMAMWEANSLYVGSLFICLFLGAAIVLSTVGWAAFTTLTKVRTRMLSLRLALRNLYRNRLSTASCFLTISLGSLLICLVPQVHDIVTEEVSAPRGLQLPSLFLVDIQEDQLPGVKQLIQSEATSLQFISPLVRARLQSINGEPVKVKDQDQATLTREQQRRRWVRNREQNLTVRRRPFPSEKIIAGREFDKFTWQEGEVAQISLEMRFASRLGVTVGDTLGFDILGVKVDTKIQNIRRVRWTSFQPNFFIAFQPGVLDDAPKVFIASVPDLPNSQKYDLQNKLVKAFPNVSIIDVANTVKRILNILGKMGWIIRLMAVFSLFAGFVVLYSIANHQAQMRRWDINLYKILGAEFGEIVRTMFWEFGLLGAFGAITGAICSFGISYLVATFVFYSPWTPVWQVPLLAIIGVSLVSIFTALWATKGVLTEKPLALLNEA